MLPIAVLPAPLSLVVMFVLIPVLHFALLRQTELSNALITATSNATAIAFPYLFASAIANVDTFCRTLSIFLSLRFLEIATLSRTFTSKWPLMDYFEFIATATNNPIRLMEAKKGDQRKSKVIHVVAGDRNAMFYLSYITKLFITWIVYTAAAAFFIKYPYVSKYGFLDFRDIKSVMQHLLYGVQMYCLVEFVYVGMLPTFIFFQAPYFPLMQNPFIASSLRDFWSNRWNSIIKGSLPRLAFLPTLRLLAASMPQKSKSKKQPEVHYMIAILVAFALSSAMHEGLITLVSDGQPLGENTIYFMLQGVFCVVEAVFLRMTGFGKSWGHGHTAAVVGWLFTALLILLPSPMFVGPYARAGIHFNKLVVPTSPGLLNFFLKYF